MLTIIDVRSARPREKVYMLNDGAGLFLRVETNGTKRWVFNRSVKGQHVSRQLGLFPAMSLKEAREEAQRLSVELRTSFRSSLFAALLTIILSYCTVKHPSLKVILLVS